MLFFVEMILSGVALSILFCGVIIGVYLRNRNLKIKQSYIKSEGTFVEFRKIWTTPQKFVGTIEYRTSDGGTHRFENMWVYYNGTFTLPKLPAIGSKIEILYDPTNPTKAVVNKTTELEQYPKLLIYTCSLMFLFVFTIFIGRIWFAFQFGL